MQRTPLLAREAGGSVGARPSDIENVGLAARLAHIAVQTVERDALRLARSARVVCLVRERAKPRDHVLDLLGVARFVGAVVVHVGRVIVEQLRRQAQTVRGESFRFFDHDREGTLASMSPTTIPTPAALERVQNELERLRAQQLPMPTDPALLAALNEVVPWLEEMPKPDASRYGRVMRAATLLVEVKCELERAVPVADTRIDSFLRELGENLVGQSNVLRALGEVIVASECAHCQHDPLAAE